jgi:hypothetical protein
MHRLHFCWPSVCEQHIIAINHFHFGGRGFTRAFYVWASLNNKYLYVHNSIMATTWCSTCQARRTKMAHFLRRQKLVSGFRMNAILPTKLETREVNHSAVLLVAAQHMSYYPTRTYVRHDKTQTDVVATLSGTLKPIIFYPICSFHTILQLVLR